MKRTIASVVNRPVAPVRASIGSDKQLHEEKDRNVNKKERKQTIRLILSMLRISGVMVIINPL